MRSAFLARDVLFTPSAEAIATSCSRSFDSSTDCSRASAATGNLLSKVVPHGTEDAETARRRAGCQAHRPPETTHPSEEFTRTGSARRQLSAEAHRQVWPGNP